MPKPMSAAGSTRVDRFIAWTKNNPVIAVAIIVATVVAGAATFADSVRKLVVAAADLTADSSGQRAVAAQTAKQLDLAATLVLAAYSRAIEQQVTDYRPPTRDEYIAAESALQSLFLLYQGQGKAEQAKAVERGLAMWTRMRSVSDLPEWQTERLKQRRQEWVSLFVSLGYEEAGGSSSASAHTPAK